MAKTTKRFKEINKLFEKGKSYTLTEAVEILQKTPSPKFDESVEVALSIGVDPKKSDQQVRSTVLLPNGTGKKVVVVVLAKGDKAKEAEKVGADFIGDQDLIEKIKNGWTDFDAIIATPDMMREVGKLGKVLGPRGLMPTPKAGTVTTDVAKAVEDIKKGKIEFKVDKNGIINNFVAKISFTKEHIVENIEAFIQAVSKVKPSTAKGQYLRSLFISTTMGPGLKIDLNSVSVS
ncbi:MAG: 50S ribosomal protein L1 [Simkania sp.]|uniref:Large ribosomal subunit protein uL1 n=1 Tax=Simkania negevensis (strain ATCC VR-1471 / DSM 27360 / Z) TaxID=331113 RepID=F8L977_SIMNZ|nr:50S ribosomal protein L1 [Simkania negevensis]MCB1068429.1 50S ribosomal protein L1 [Simkania sp.]MCP5490802.1 50S ribosomal protein L1 [Chlamydiales bacterium]MCB1074194.1 50S ribosomal protein L1 [Simkania sp.]MCB1083315.1 50S ribosomal protein L1 [Simkania sp.]CCB89392.1 50S ribosomal protein L1 [Simkania negevensis Z]